MFDTDSRYYAIETASFVTDDGRDVRYKRRRFAPRGEEMPLLVETTANQGERLDQITTRTLGNPEHFWRICDANNVISPFELTATHGKVIRVPVPQA